MEGFLGDNAKVVHGIWNFLELDAPANAEHWWETIGKYPPDDPKAALNWWRGHASSAVKPQENDTRVELRSLDFWREILPVFDKYYDAIPGTAFKRPEIEADLKQLDTLIGRYHHPIESCFTSFESQTHNSRFTNKRPARNRSPKAAFNRVLRVLGVK